MKRLFAILPLMAALSASPAAGAPLRVLTLNIQTDASGGRLPGLVDLIRASSADVVGLQEAETVGPELARRLGFRHAQVGEDTAVLSRFELSASSGEKRAVTITLPDGRRLLFLDLHLYYKPYQPYQLLKIPYEGRFIDTEAEAIEEARRARGAETEETLTQIRLASATLPVIVVGDLNEPSHLDWTDAAVKRGRQPLRVAWPQTKAFADAGFKDAFREVYPDEVAHPGLTWTPTKKLDDPKEHHDRIDFVLYRGARLRPSTAQIVGEDADAADIVVTPFPTDHRGVVIGFETDR